MDDPRELDERGAQEALRRLLTVVTHEADQPPDENESLETMTARLVALGHALVSGTESCAFAMAVPGHPVAVLPGSEQCAANAFEAQLSAAEGPALDLLGRHGMVRLGADDGPHARRWPRLRATLTDLGVGSMIVTDIAANRRSRGVVVLCSAAPGAFDAASEPLMRIFASRATGDLRRRQNIDDLTQAVRSRQFIGQAVGILMERHRVTAEVAFGQLVDESQRRNVKLHVIATHLIDTGEDPHAAAPAATGDVRT